MTSIRKPLSVLFLALCFSASHSKAQEIVTSPNLIDPGNWSGAVYGVDPGGCCASISGAGALYDTSTDTIMFSYGLSTLSQTIGLQQALGTVGLQIHGYNVRWDFRYISNNGTQNDSLYFDVSLIGSTGVLESQRYSYDSVMAASILPYDTWLSANGTHNYTTPYADPQSISFSITGRDGGFWAGYYGPEVRNVSLSVNYSVDPCAADPLYSSSCPGYWDAFIQQIGAVLNWGASPSTATASTSTDPMVSEMSIPAITESTETVSQAPVTDPSSPESETAQERRETDPRALSIARAAQAQAAMTAASVVQQSTEQSQSAAATQDAMSAASVQQSTDQSQTMPDPSQDISAGSPVSDTLSGTASDRGEALGTGLTLGTESVVTETSTDVAATRPRDPLSEARNPTATQPQESSVASTGSVSANREPPSELAGGVDFAQFSVVPQGFSAYTALALRDGVMYAPREIYPDQRPIDNARVLRGLGSDRLHQEMINQQYGR